MDVVITAIDSLTSSRFSLWSWKFSSRSDAAVFSEYFFSVLYFVNISNNNTDLVTLLKQQTY